MPPRRARPAPVQACPPAPARPSSVPPRADEPLLPAAPAWLALALSLQAMACAWAAPATQAVGSALDRPAVQVRQIDSALLQSAAQAGPQLIAVGERGLIVASRDQGQHWQQVDSPVSVGLTAVRFADAQHGVAVGHGATVLTTTDGGAHWLRRLDGRGVAAIELAAAHDDAARQAAERLKADGPDKPWLDAWMTDAQRITVVGAYGLALHSDDGGQHWQSWRGRLDNPKELHLYAVRQRGAQWLIAGEQGLVLVSDDQGEHFRRVDTPYKGSFFTAELPADGSLWVAGLRGNAWRSSDGGASWQALPAPLPASFTASALTPDGRLLLANQAGLVLQAQGDQLKPLPLPPVPSLTGLLPLPQGQLLALTVQGPRVLSPSPTARP